MSVFRLGACSLNTENSRAKCDAMVTAAGRDKDSKEPPEKGKELKLCSVHFASCPFFVVVDVQINFSAVDNSVSPEVLNKL